MRVDRRIRLRTERVHRAVVRCLGRAQGRFGMRVVHYSVQHGQLHLLVEAAHRKSLSRGMQGLSIRMSKAVNRTLGRGKGQVFVDRYHAEQLRSPRQVRHAVAYVLNNRRRHIQKLGKPQPPSSWVDPFCSARVRGRVLQPTGPPPCAEPRTWLAAVGWKRYGLVPIDQVPG